MIRRMTRFSALALAAVVPGTLHGAPLDEDIEQVTPSIVEIRHRIHQNPELGFREHETAQLVARHLQSLGLTEIRTGVAGTGVVATLKGGRPGPMVAVRADMDALPVTEATDLPFASTRRDVYEGQEVGVAHACGHDVHTAVLLGVASVLARMRDALPGAVRFIFQPAEEGPPAGVMDAALQMVEAGVLESPEPEAIFALHSAPSLDVGEAGWSPGPAMAASDRVRITIRGKQSHGAAPHEGIDPIVLGSQAVMALQTIRSRSLPPLAPSVVTIGIFRGGTRFNIIPGEVHLEGTVRSYDDTIRDQIRRRMHEILAGISASGGGTYDLEYVEICPPTVNDEALTTRAVETLERTLGADSVHRMDPLMAGEDFAFFAREVPGFYFHLGVRAPGGDSGGLHTPGMRADDGAVEVGIRAMTAVILDYLGSGGRGVAAD